MNYIMKLVSMFSNDIKSDKRRASCLSEPDCKKCFTPEVQMEIIKLLTTLGAVEIYTLPYAGEGDKYCVSVIEDGERFSCISRDISEALAQQTYEYIRAGFLNKSDVEKLLNL